MTHKFMCGKCCFKHKLNKSERISMAARLVEGVNKCEDCGFELIYENGRWVKASTFIAKQARRPG